MSSPGPYSGILVGVDGSPPSTRALRWAVREAAMRKAPLTIVHVRTPLPMNSTAMTWAAAPIPQEVFDWQDEQAQAVINDAIKIVEDSTAHSGVPQVTSEVICAAPVPTLVDLTKDAQMIVVGCRGQGALQRGLLGSVSTGLVHHAHCPVAVIHDEDPIMAHPERAPVLVGIDGSPASELATAIAFDEASWRGVDLVAMHAWSDAEVSDLPSLELSDIQSVAEEALAERLAGWRDRYPDVRVSRIVVFDQPARHLLEKSESAQLVVVGSHGRGGFVGMLLGSVSTAIVHAAHTPVIVARQR
jgi:nucleotide-binding universal stress UspA family protein